MIFLFLICINVISTSSVNLPAQLDCGSRSFDYRPYYSDGTLYAHHGPYVVRKPMSDVFSEVMAWCNAHPTELVIFDINSCDGDDGCYEAALALVQSLGVYMVNDCNVLSALTYSGAKSAGKLPGGGSLIAVFDCTEGLYDDTINCYSKDYTCYDSWPAESSNEPWNHMKEYMRSVTVQIPVADGRLFSAQV